MYISNHNSLGTGIYCWVCWKPYLMRAAKIQTNVTITKASKQSIGTVNTFPIPLSLTPPGLNYNKGGKSTSKCLCVRKATFTMQHVNSTIYLCCFVWCALQVVRKGSIILSACQYPIMNATYKMVVKVDTQIFQEASTGTLGILTEVYKHKLEHYPRKWRWEWHTGTCFYRHVSVTRIKNLNHVM